MDDPNDSQPEEEAVSFRLFAATAPAKVRLSATPEVRDPGLARGRPDGCYFAPALEEDSAAWTELQKAAITGPQIEELANRQWPGAKMPWRVTILTQSKKEVATLTAHYADHHDGTRKLGRKGKKARAAVRKVKARELERERLAAVAATDRELAERMKRAKRNRDKKLRQRGKEKERKAALRGERGGAGAEGKGEGEAAGEEEEEG